MANTKRRINLARSLRRSSTEAERKLWSKLRAGRLNGYPFKRQYPLSPYILDFACVSAKINIELDGSQHADNPDDRKRDLLLTSQGWQVLRFWNKEVLMNMDNLLQTILGKLEERTPSPALPRSAGEGEGS